MLPMDGIIQWFFLEGSLHAAWGILREMFRLSLVVLAGLGLGHWTCRKLKVPAVSIGDLVVYSVGLGLGELSLLVLLLAVGGLLYSWMAWLLLICGLCLFGYQICRADVISRIIHAFPRWESLSIPSLFNLFLLLVIVSSFFYSFIAYAMVPPMSWDEISYHLAIPKIYVQHHRIIYIPYIAYSNMPFTMEMLYTLALLLGSDILPHLLTLTTSLLTGGALVLFSRKYLHRQVGLLAATLYFNMQMIKRLSGVALVDVPLGLFSFLAVCTFWGWLEKREIPWLLLSAMLSGFAASTKLTGAAIPLILTAILVFDGLVRRGTQFRVVVEQAFLYGLISFLVVGPWYLKSYLYTGNPIWPFGYDVFGGRDWDSLGTEYLLGYLHTTNLSPTLSNFVLMPWYLFKESGQFGGYAIGGFVLGFAPLSLAFRGDKARLVNYLVIVCASFYSVWFFLTHQSRFLLPIVPTLCVLSAYSFYRLCQVKIKGLTLLCQAGVLFYFIVGLPFIDAVQQDLLNDGSSYIMGKVSRQDFLEQRINTYEVFQYANSQLPPEAKILLIPYESRGYYLDREYIWANPISQRFIKFEQIPNADALAKKLKEMGISHLILNPSNVFTNVRFWDHCSHLLNNLKEKYAEPIYEKNDIILYKLQVD
jgi:hypothetical protein